MCSVSESAARLEVIRASKVVAEKKIKAVVDRGSSPLKIKYYRELRED